MKNINELISNPIGGHVIIPIYSDIHGRIEVLFKSVMQLQNATKRTYSIILLTGDLGWFPYPEDLPVVIKKIEIKSENDLGFQKFIAEVVTGKPASGRQTLKQRYYENARDPLRLEAKFYFLRGNHEDHELLKNIETSGNAITPADPSGTFNYLSDGRVIAVVTPNGERLNIASFGGVHAESRPGRTLDNPKMVFDEVAMNLLLTIAAKEKIDVLLTHQGPAATLGGHDEIDTLIELVRPQIHVHGHSGQYHNPSSIAKSKSYCVPDLQSATAHAFALDWNVDKKSVCLISI